MCFHDNLRFNLISKVNHPTVLETAQRRVPYNVLCAEWEGILAASGHKGEAISRINHVTRPERKNEVFRG